MDTSKKRHALQEFALKYFSDNENALLEYSILKERNQTESAMKLLLRLKEINPKNIKAKK